MFICEIWLFVWYFPQFCTSDMSKYGYLELYQRVPRLRDNESRLCNKINNIFFFLIYFQTQDTNTNIFVHYPYLESIRPNLS